METRRFAVEKLLACRKTSQSSQQQACMTNDIDPGRVSNASSVFV